MSSLLRSARLGWRRPPSWTNSSVPKKTRIPVGQPARIRIRDRPCWRYPFEGGRRQFSTLDIWQSPDKFTGKRRIQIYVYVYIYIRSLFRSARLGWLRPPLRTNSSIPKKTRIPVGQPIRIRNRDRPHWQYPFEGGRYCCRSSQWWPGGSKKMGEGWRWTVHQSIDS